MLNWWPRMDLPAAQHLSMSPSFLSRTNAMDVRPMDWAKLIMATIPGATKSVNDGFTSPNTGVPMEMGDSAKAACSPNVCLERIYVKAQVSKPQCRKGAMKNVSGMEYLKTFIEFFQDKHIYLLIRHIHRHLILIMHQYYQFDTILHRIAFT